MRVGVGEGEGGRGRERKGGREREGGRERNTKSHADVLFDSSRNPRHAIFPPDCVTSQKNFCLGG